jgi:type II secretory pathway component PulF
MALGLSAKAELFAELASVLSSGLPMTEALDLVERRRFASRSAARHAVAALASAVRRGEPLSEGMRGQAEAFTAVEVAVVRSGEQSGRIEDALRICASALEKRVARRRRLLLGLAYPAFLLHFVVALAPLAADPAYGFGSGYVWRMLPGWILLDGGVAAGIWLHRRSSGRPGYVAALRRIPVVGRAWVDAGLARYLRALAALYGAGTPLREGTRLAALAAAEPTLAVPLEDIARGVERGEPLAAQLARSARFPEEVRRSLEIGEESGTLGEKLERAALFLEERADRAQDLAVRLVAKTAYVVAALGVTLVVVSFYSRLYTQIQ